jgi:hypothetical protein
LRVEARACCEGLKTRDHTGAGTRVFTGATCRRGEQALCCHTAPKIVRSSERRSTWPLLVSTCPAAEGARRRKGDAHELVFH